MKLKFSPSIPTPTGEEKVFDQQQTFGMKMLNALADVQSGLDQLNNVLPADEILMATQVAIMGPAAFALDYAEGKLVDTVAGDLFGKVATLFNAGAHTASVEQAEYFLNGGDQFAARMDQLYARLEASPRIDTLGGGSGLLLAAAPGQLVFQDEAVDQPRFPRRSGIQTQDAGRCAVRAGRFAFELDEGAS